MKQNLIQHLRAKTLARINATLDCLGLSLELAREIAVESLGMDRNLLQALDEQERVLAHMREVVNMLREQVDAGDYAAIARSMKIFRCLHEILAPEVVATTREIGRSATRTAGASI